MKIDTLCITLSATHNKWQCIMSLGFASIKKEDSWQMFGLFKVLVDCH